MLYYTRTGDTIVIPDGICTHAGLDLAHHQMQHHRTCRIDHCAWKWVAYTTLIHHGRIVPSETSPHERALHRGLWVPDISAPQPFQQILDGLDRLVRDLREPGRTEP
jgi:hypothetical protein